MGLRIYCAGYSAECTQSQGGDSRPKVQHARMEPKPGVFALNAPLSAMNPIRKRPLIVRSHMDWGRLPSSASIPTSKHSNRGRISTISGRSTGSSCCHANSDNYTGQTPDDASLSAGHRMREFWRCAGDSFASWPCSLHSTHPDLAVDYSC